jgi:phosphate transport system permease protein
MGDAVFRNLTRTAAVAVLIILGGIIVSLVYGSLPALRTFGIGFLFTESWNPVTEKFGAVAPIYGTVVTSLIAMLIAVPVGLFIALFLTELCPMCLRRPIGTAIELLAGIPSIIYGLWGLFVFAPFLQQYVQPFLIAVFGKVPVLSTLFEGPPYGIGILTAGLILAIMVLPFITSISRDVFEAVPPVLKEAAYGLGCTTGLASLAASCWVLAARSARPWRSPLSSAMRIAFRGRSWRPAQRSPPPSPMNSPKRLVTFTRRP